MSIHSIPSDWQSLKDNCIKLNQPFNILPPSITVSDFVFHVPVALSCCVAISVDCLWHSCQTHFNHSLAPVMLRSDEENWRALKTVHIFTLMFFGSFFSISLLPPPMRMMLPHPSSPSYAPTFLMRVTPLEGGGLSLVLLAPPGRRGTFNDPTWTIPVESKQMASFDKLLS